MCIQVNTQVTRYVGICFLELYTSQVVCSNRAHQVVTVSICFVWISDLRRRFEVFWPLRMLFWLQTFLLIYQVPHCPARPKMNSFIALVCGCQRDHMARLILNVWPFTSMIICPKAQLFCQSRFNILPNIKVNPQLMTPQTIKILPKWRFFAKSDHAGGWPPMRPLCKFVW